MVDRFTAHNELENRLIAAQQGELDSAQFMHELLLSQVFMPVEDEPSGIQGFQRSARANPLTLEAEDGQNVLILFTSPERAKPFLQDFPAFQGGLLTEFTWILERIGSGIAISLNPGIEFGIDFDASTVEQLIHTSRQQQSPSPAS
jgi:SseB protein N-terminal domain